MSAHDDLRHLAETLCWMGGTAIRAASAGLPGARPEGILLTEAGWAFAAELSPGPR